MTDNNEPTVLIIGAGVFGASTAYHLSKQYKSPSKITVIDRTELPPAPAASTDINKIIRADYSSPFYAELAYEAMDAWANWPELGGYYHRTGWVMLDEEGSGLAERIREMFRRRGRDPTEDIEVGEELEKKRWKGILKGTKTEGFGKAYWNPEAGWCDAAAATKAVMQAAIDRGVNYVGGDVERLVLGEGQVTGIRTKDGRSLFADQVVMATGAWTSQLLSPIEDDLEIGEADRVEHQASAAGVAVIHFKMSDEEMERLSEMPVVVYGEHGEVIPPPKEKSLLKYTNAKTFTNYITTPSGRRISAPPADRDQRDIPDALKEEFRMGMCANVMPTFSRNKEADYYRLCWDSYTPTQDWLLGPHPHAKLSNLFLAVGGSFHSYKFLPIIGKYMVNVLSGIGNGEEKDRAWAWKDATDVKGGGAHEGTRPRRDLGELMEGIVEREKGWVSL